MVVNSKFNAVSHTAYAEVDGNSCCLGDGILREGVDTTSAALCSAVEEAVWEMAYSVKGLILLAELYIEQLSK